MDVAITEQTGLRAQVARTVAPFTTTVPAAIRDPLTMLQYQRLHALTPLLCLTIAANAIAMALAVMGDLPVWQQLVPPTIVVAVCLARLATWRNDAVVTPAAAYHSLQKTVFVAGGLGLLSGIWAVNAFGETEKYFCMVAPVFLAITALVSANCLTSIPGAATAAMVMALSPIVVRMLIFDNLGIRSMAVMLVLIGALQIRLVRVKFFETEKMLILQHDIVALAEADALTGLKNRRAFAGSLQAQLDTGEPVTVAMIDLDGFKLANDTYGHHAGDEVLISVAERMKTVAVNASCVARLGGDEFALVFGGGVSGAQVRAEVDAVRAMIALPHRVEDDLILISASVGLSHSTGKDCSMSTLLKAADRALYADKRKRKTKPRKASAAA